MLLYEIILYSISFILLIYKIFTAKSSKDLFLFIAFSLILFITAIYANVNFLTLFSGYIIFNGMISSYGTKLLEAFSIIGAYFIFISYLTAPVIITLAIFFGGISSYSLYPKKKHRSKKTTYKKELFRNIFTIISGFVLIFLLVFSTLSSYLLIGLIFLIGILLLNTSIIYKKGPLSRLLYILERKNFRLGHGAIWLGIGTCFAISYFGFNYAVPVISFIFIADCVSPIFGIKFGKAKLPYNKHKSFIGTLSYFVVGAVIAYFFIGYLGIILAGLGAIIESLPVLFDDNFDVPLALFIFVKIFGL